MDFKAQALKLNQDIRDLLAGGIKEICLQVSESRQLGDCIDSETSLEVVEALESLLTKSIYCHPERFYVFRELGLLRFDRSEYDKAARAFACYIDGLLSAVQLGRLEESEYAHEIATFRFLHGASVIADSILEGTDPKLGHLLADPDSVRLMQLEVFRKVLPMLERWLKPSGSTCSDGPTILDEPFVSWEEFSKQAKDIQAFYNYGPLPYYTLRNVLFIESLMYRWPKQFRSVSEMEREFLELEGIAPKVTSRPLPNDMGRDLTALALSDLATGDTFTLELTDDIEVEIDEMPSMLLSATASDVNGSQYRFPWAVFASVDGGYFKVHKIQETPSEFQLVLANGAIGATAKARTVGKDDLLQAIRVPHASLLLIGPSIEDVPSSLN